MWIDWIRITAPASETLHNMRQLGMDGINDIPRSAIERNISQLLQFVTCLWRVPASDPVVRG